MSPEEAYHHLFNLKRQLLNRTPKQEHVFDAYKRIRKVFGSPVSQKFHQLMREWDGNADVMNSYYDRDVIEMKRLEALELVKQEQNENNIHG